jgi:hypothetical protein
MVRRASADFEMSVSPVHCIRALRLVLEHTGWTLERHEGARMVDRFAIIMPITQTTRTLGLRITDGPLRGLEMTCWAETKGSAGAINIASWILPGGMDDKMINSLLKSWVANLPRCPWHWTFYERSKIGYLLPVWRRSKKAFLRLGFNTRSKVWPLDENEFTFEYENTFEQE